MSTTLDQYLRHVELLRARVQHWSDYPFSIPAISTLDRLVFSPHVTFFVGENGAGKSTLLEAIAVKAGFSGAGGSRTFNARSRPTDSTLDEHLRLARGATRERNGFFLRADTMHNLSTAAEELGAHGMDNLHQMSHGEAFLAVAINRFSRNGLYLLDEPEAALSPQRQLAFLGRMRQLVEQGSQFIISTHSPILMAYPSATIYSFDTKITKVAYKDTEHYAVTKAFLHNPEGMMQRIFGGTDDDSER